MDSFATKYGLIRGCFTITIDNMRIFDYGAVAFVVAFITTCALSADHY